MSQEFANSLHPLDPRGPTLAEPSDEQIMREVQQGDGDAFALLFDRYHRLVLVTALKILRDVGEAQEVTQNVFLEVYRAAGKFDPARGTLKVWLLQYAYHRSINRRNYLLLRHFYSQSGLEEASSWEASAGWTPQVPVQELTRLVDEALSTLNEAQRWTIKKVVFEGLTLREAAEESKESLSNVRNHYYRGLDRLRACLTAQPTVAPQEKLMIPLGEVSRGKA